jgi:hypothetical protein
MVSVIVALLGVIGILVGTLIGVKPFADLGVSFVAAGLVSLFYLYEMFVSEVAASRAYRLDKAGIRNIYPSRGEVDYATVMRHAHGRVDIMGYSLRAFTDMHAQQVIAKSAAGLEARILVVDSESQSAKDQEKGEGYPPGTFRGGVARVKQVFGNKAPAIQVKTTWKALPEMVFRIDDVMWVGPYFSERASGTTVTLELAEDGWLFQEYAQEFDALWASGK